MNERLQKLIEAECEYLRESGWVLTTTDSWSHHVWNFPAWSDPLNEYDHDWALALQKSIDKEKASK